MGWGVPRWVERDFRSYLRCGILAHGFARVRFTDCGHDQRHGGIASPELEPSGFIRGLHVGHANLQHHAPRAPSTATPGPRGLHVGDGSQHAVQQVTDPMLDGHGPEALDIDRLG